VTAIKLDRGFVRLNDAEVQCFKAASDYFRLRLGEQTLANPISTAFAKHP
jgi:hypothetical protein